MLSLLTIHILTYLTEEVIIDCIRDYLYHAIISQNMTTASRSKEVSNEI